MCTVIIVQCRPILRCKIISIPIKQILYISLMSEMNILGAFNPNESKKSFRAPYFVHCENPLWNFGKLLWDTIHLGAE
jgi:hypothetical protein